MLYYKTKNSVVKTRLNFRKRHVQFLEGLISHETETLEEKVSFNFAS